MMPLKGMVDFDFLQLLCVVVISFKGIWMTWWFNFILFP
jgi:hypothetical protein